MYENAFTISGRITDMRCNGSFIITIQQKVAGRFDSSFQVFVPPDEELLTYVNGLDLDIGDKILVLGGTIYKKGGIRVRITERNQIFLVSKSPAVNTLSLSGECISVEEEGSGLLMTLVQKVGGKFSMDYKIHITGSIAEWVKETIGEDENVEICIHHGIVYEKDDDMRIRISKKDNLQRITPVYDLGVEDAEDKFM